MISATTWQFLQNTQNELDKLIYQQAEVKWDWVSRINAKRQKLNILVEIGELANELKTSKIWRNKKDADWDKVKEELIDCLCFFLGLCTMFNIDLAGYKFNNPKRNLEVNELLLKFFSQTNYLYIPEKEKEYKLREFRLSTKKIQTYYDWLQIFNEIVNIFKIDEQELLKIYLNKNKLNQQRVIIGK